ncbi:hypothetical protein GWK48_06225 [Metallosphaera tengchongensis]|uniref:Signal recognition particle 19 kDa protein n=1 Tax=Metallosphaera tengchongensis TaxID=1532350 RepID=A0A6N0NXC5_9CREN|nr:signal recognition particle subunit SRP19/SEC65 family protein [Metallosphaera tengchongensis]QKR00028.1 hypothetical protein GWK48_06225 [Metallosphaera tengchongensis]
MSLRDYEGERVVIWLAYFVATSRREGRKFPKLRITLKEIVDVSKEMGLDPIVLEKTHPSSKIKGMLVVKKIGSKQKTIKAIYEKLKHR